MSKKEFDLRIFGLVNIGAKGQVVIPANARKEFGLCEGDEVIVFGSEPDKFLGVMTEEDFRAVLEKLQHHIDKGLSRASEKSETFAKISKQLSEQRARKSGLKDGQSNK